MDRTFTEGFEQLDPLGLELPFNENSEDEERSPLAPELFDETPFAEAFEQTGEWLVDPVTTTEWVNGGMSEGDSSSLLAEEPETLGSEAGFGGFQEQEEEGFDTFGGLNDEDLEPEMEDQEHEQPPEGEELAWLDYEAEDAAVSSLQAMEGETELSFAHEEEEYSEAPAWTGSADQIDFRDRVLARHIALRKFQLNYGPFRDLRRDEMAFIRGTEKLTCPDTAEAASQLLAAAKIDLEKAQASGDADAQRTISIGIDSAYRSGARQRERWLELFPRYYTESRAAREKLPGGRHSKAAIAYMLRPSGFGLAGRIAAPGFSKHQAGVGIDFLQKRKPGHKVINSTARAARANWRSTWFYKWLTDEKNGARFGFEQLPTEEWHWNFLRPKTLTSPARQEALEPSSEVSPKPLLGGSIWTYASQACGTTVALFVPPAAWTRDKLDVMLFVHGLLNVCRPKPAKLPEGLIADAAPLNLGQIVTDSGRPMVLVVPLFQPPEQRWSTHKLELPATLNALFAEALAEVSRHLNRPTVEIDQLVIAGHSRAFGVLYPLARSHASPALATGALARLSRVWVLDATYGTPPNSAFKSLAAAKPGLRIDIIYRVKSLTDKYPGKSRVGGAVALRPVNAKAMSHCEVPGKMLPKLLAELPAPSSYGEDFRLSGEGADREVSEVEMSSLEGRPYFEARGSNPGSGEDYEGDVSERRHESLAWLDMEDRVHPEAFEPEWTEVENFEPEGLDLEESFDTFEQEGAPSHAFKDCSTAQRKLLVDSADRSRRALAWAEKYVADAHGRPHKMSATVRRLLLEHFHTTERRPLRDILTNLFKLRKAFEKGIRFECEASCTGAQGYAQTSQWFGGFGNVHICFGGSFNFADPTVTDETRDVLLIHEVAHRYLGFKGNVIYGDAAYAKLTAKQAMSNADSYAVFAYQMNAARPKFQKETEAGWQEDPAHQEDGEEGFEEAWLGEVEEQYDEERLDAFGEDPEAEELTASLEERELDPALMDIAERVMAREEPFFENLAPKRWTTCFSAADIGRVEKVYQDNSVAASGNAVDRCSCIVMLNVGLGQLLSLPTKSHPARSKSERRVQMAKLPTVTIEEAMAKLRGLGHAGARTVIWFLDRRKRRAVTLKPERLQASVEARVRALAATKGCWYAFGLSLLDGYHSVLLLVDRTGDDPRIYWLDQFKGGLTDDVTGKLDERITERTQTFWQKVWDDKRKAHNGVVRIWPLRKRRP